MDLYFHEESIKARRLKYKNKFQPSNYPPLMLDCCCWCQIEFRSPGIFYEMWFSLPQTWVIFSHLFTFAIQKLSNGKLIERMWTYIAQLISWQMRVGTKPCWLYLVLEPLSLKSLPAFSASSSHSESNLDAIIRIFETLTHVRPLLLLALWIWKTLSSIPPHHLALPQFQITLTANLLICLFSRSWVTQRVFYIVNIILSNFLQSSFFIQIIIRWLEAD